MKDASEEISGRRRALDSAVASNRLEGHEADPAFADLHEAMVAGRIGFEAAMGEVVKRVIGSPRPEPDL